MFYCCSICGIDVVCRAAVSRPKWMANRCSRSSQGKHRGSRNWSACCHEPCAIGVVEASAKARRLPLRRPMWLCLGEQMNVGGAHAKCPSDFEDVGEAGVAFAALDAADVGRVEVGHVRKSRLTESSLMADGADRAAKGSVGRRAGHGRTICA